MPHIPVLKKEVLQYLNPENNKNIIDCTIDGGGHSYVILEKNKPGGKVLGIELDKELCQKLENLDRLIIVNDSYVNLKKIVGKNNFIPVNGILFDLGMSSWQIEESGRGFTFQKNEPLDMRYDISRDLTAGKIVNQWPEDKIADILKRYGEERFAEKIAKNIIKARPLKTTFDLVKAIGWRRKGRIHPATRVFQALRITANNELECLERSLSQAEEILAPKGRLVVISFHSLEDRIVKNFFKKSNLRILTKKPITALSEEIKSNPRARSAKLRAGEKNDNLSFPQIKH